MIIRPLPMNFAKYSMETCSRAGSRFGHMSAWERFSISSDNENGQSTNIVRRNTPKTTHGAHWTKQSYTSPFLILRGSDDAKSKQRHPSARKVVTGSRREG